ncbi:MAG: alpha/beta fold hydrolase [Micropruina sp.]|nr:alpha/beta fold hydrolase [Micropruina sp.]
MWIRDVLLRRNPLTRMKVQEMEIDGARVRLHELAPVDANGVALPGLPTFVLVHGLGVSSRYFVPLSVLLAEHGRVVLIDLPGFAGLPRPARTFTINDFADVARQAVDKLGVVRPVLVGHSMGAQVVVEMAADQPSYSPAVVLVGPVVNATERRLPMLALRFLQSATKESGLNALVAASQYATCGLNWLRETVPTVLHYPIEERLRRVDSRVVLISGDGDYVSPLAWRTALAGELESARTVTIKGAAHGVVFDHAPLLAREVLALVGITEESEQ